eukprot:GHRQ01021827.1.p2 GENE.GHRQ01021827.1~~GHRQ01021827.1.p2  ORF type:complete len:115 (-),score=37.63 GHRQ01021827.1:747-1091(-)
MCIGCITFRIVQPNTPHGVPAGPLDPPLQGLQYATLAAGEVECLLSRARGLAMVQLVVGWDAAAPQPVYNPLLLHSLQRALQDENVSIFISKAAGGKQCAGSADPAGIVRENCC